jgi:hypothetical protein
MINISVEKKGLHSPINVSARSSKGRTLNFETAGLVQLLTDLAETIPGFSRNAAETAILFGGSYSFDNDLEEIREQDLFRRLADLQHAGHAESVSRSTDRNMEIEIKPPNPKRPEEGVLRKLDVEPHNDIVEKGDNLLRDPQETSEEPMNDKLE